jgi:hypothetical protein
MVTQADMPSAARVRVLDEALKNVPLTETNTLDEASFKASVDALVQREAAYVAQLAEAAGVGQPRGLGESAPTGGEREQASLIASDLVEVYSGAACRTKPPSSPPPVGSSRKDLIRYGDEHRPRRGQPDLPGGDHARQPRFRPARPGGSASRRGADQQAGGRQRRRGVECCGADLHCQSQYTHLQTRRGRREVSLRSPGS